MADLVVIVPSRGRPAAVAELADAFAKTCTADTVLFVANDSDDPELDRYAAAGYGRWVGPHQSMVAAVNDAVPVALGLEFPFAVGFMGDDHRPRTHGWDTAYLVALREMGTGIVYGDDLLQRERLPTQCAMTADIVRALGWMIPPRLIHMYADNFWLDLGRLTGRIRYLPEVVVEHLHPLAGKAEWDAGHLRVNDPAIHDKDRVAYARFKAEGGLAAAAAKVRTVAGG